MLNYEDLSLVVTLYVLENKQIRRESDRVFYKNATKYRNLFNSKINKVKNVIDTLNLEEEDSFRKIYGIFLSKDKDNILDILKVSDKPLIDLVSKKDRLDTSDFLEKHFKLSSMKITKDIVGISEKDIPIREKFAVYHFLILLLGKEIEQDMFFFTFSRLLEEEFKDKTKRESYIFETKDKKLLYRKEIYKEILRRMYKEHDEEDNIKELTDYANDKTYVIAKLFQAYNLEGYIKSKDGISYENTIKYIDKLMYIFKTSYDKTGNDKIMQIDIEELILWIGLSYFLDSISDSIEKEKSFYFNQMKKLISKKEVEESLRRLPILEREKENLNRIIRNNQEKIINLDNKIKDLEKVKLNNLEVRSYIEKIQSLEKKLDKIEEERKEEKVELNELRNYVFEEEKDSMDSTPVEENFDFNEYSNYKIILAGGYAPWVNSLKEKLPYGIFITKENLNFDINIFNDVDLVLIKTKGMSHALYYKVINELRKRNIKPKYVTNEENVKKKLKSLLKK